MPRLMDNQGRFVRTPHHLKTNPSSSGADSPGNTTPSEEDIQTLAERLYSGQHITLAERETLFAHKSQQKPFPRSSTQGKSSTITKQSSFLSFPPRDQLEWLRRDLDQFPTKRRRSQLLSSLYKNHRRMRRSK